MCARNLHVACIALLALVTLWATPSFAWVETSIRSHSATIEIERSGEAVIRHELVLKVRGGPLKSYSLAGVEADAVLLDGASVSQIGSDRTLKLPLLLHLQEDGVLVAEVDATKGLRSGVYLFDVSYRADFKKGKRLEAGKDGVTLSWVGPRFDDGIDSAKVIFRTPRAERLPSVWEDPNGSGALDFNLNAGSVLVSQRRQLADKDELELVRAHLAKGEPPLWKISLGSKAFGAEAAPEKRVAGSGLIGAARGERDKAQRLGDSAIVGLIVGLVYCLLAALKSIVSGQQARRRDATFRRWIPMPWSVSAALSGAALGGGYLVAMGFRDATIGGGLLLLAMALSAQRAPLPCHRARGPGQWQRREKLALPPTGVRLARLLDASTSLGLGLCALCVLGVLGAAACATTLDTYLGLVVALGAPALLPLFATGVERDLPPDAVPDAQVLISWLARRLRKQPGVRATPLLRMPLKQGAATLDAEGADELRLRIEATNFPEGLKALEVAVEYDVGPAGAFPRPCLVLRTSDESPAYFALGREVVWTRGRGRDERVCVLRPALPTRHSFLQLTRALIAQLSEPLKRDAARSDRMSEASGIVTRRAMPEAAASATR